MKALIFAMPLIAGCLFFSLFANSLKNATENNSSKVVELILAQQAQK